MKQVKCDSGLMGWECELRKNYDSFTEFEAYCKHYSLHTRLGFATPQEAWKENPVIQGSTEPSDFKRVSNIFG